MQSLFPTRPARGNRTRILSFNAGKMITSSPNENGKCLVTPDPRRGTLVLERSSVDQLLHICWIDRNTGRVEDDRIVFPGDVAFKKISTGRDHDRVYLLKYVVSNQKSLFWLQDKSAEKDQQNVDRLHEYINNPAAAEQAATAAVAAASAGSRTEPGAAAGAMGPDAWMQMMGLTGAGAPSSASSSQVPEVQAPGGNGSSSNGNGGGTIPNPYSNLDLSSLLSQFAMPPPPVPSTTTSAPALPAAAPIAPAAARTHPLALQDIITGEGVLRSGILDDPQVVASLLEHLPEGQRDESSLRDTLLSAQFRQALQSLSEALQSDNFESIVASLDIDPTPGMEDMVRGDNVRALLRALIAQYPPSGSGGNGDAAGGGSV